MPQGGPPSGQPPSGAAERHSRHDQQLLRHTPDSRRRRAAGAGALPGKDRGKAGARPAARIGGNVALSL